jgi:2,4-dienoyl-CoA reductase-like NADH-dependent reductase (Old Yellow Enzyme family)
MSEISLFSPLKMREIQIRNRIFMSPMCQYSAVEGVANEWHHVHLGTRAAGGVGLVMVEATAVSPEARITPSDLGLWNEAQAEALKPIVAFIKSQGATPAIQLAHAGRKASCAVPWQGGRGLSESQGGWQVVGPAEISFSEHNPTPKVLDTHGEEKVLQDFLKATERALRAGFEVLEVHMAHGYLLHEYLSPLSNPGKSLGERMMFPLQVAAEVRKAWPSHLPLLVRISASDWVEQGWDVEQSISLVQGLKAMGIDMIDVSSGGLVPHAKIPSTPHYQVPFSAKIRKLTGIKTGAVGLITDPVAAQKILDHQEADAVSLARELLRNPYWALQAAKILGKTISWPQQYTRAQ